MKSKRPGPGSTRSSRAGRTTIRIRAPIRPAATARSRPAPCWSWPGASGWTKRHPDHAASCSGSKPGARPPGTIGAFFLRGAAMSKLFAPELLCPAGTLKSMRYAFAYGADAVYAGQPRYSLRVRNNEFDHANLQTGIDEAHAQGKRFYVVVNIAPHNAKLKTFLKDLEPVIAMQPDALIMSDPGLIMLVRERFPDMPVHLSVQANAVNWASVEFWRRQGLTRVILSRELGLEEIAEIRQQVPDMELEVFVHGALCMAYSGRCLLSGYINRRDPNQG